MARGHRVKMRSSRKRREARANTGLLTPEELVVHRELEALRAGRHGSPRHVAARYDKLAEAKRIAQRHGVT